MLTTFAVVWATFPFLLEQARLSRFRGLGHALLVGALSLVCALQPIEWNADREVYQQLIAEIANSAWQPFGVTEPAFYLLVKVLSLLLPASALQFAVYFATALVSIGLKLRLFLRIGGRLEFYCLVFFSYYFLVQDATQIRAAVAVPLIYLGLLEHLRRRTWTALAFVLIASCFHYSALVGLPLLAAIDRRGGLKFASIACVLSLIGFVVVADRQLYLDLLLGWTQRFDLPKLQLYLDLLDLGIFDQIGFISRLAPHAVLLVVMLILRNRWTGDRRLRVLLQTYVLGVLLFIVLSPLPVLAYRVSDIFLFSSVLVGGRVSVHLRRRGLRSRRVVRGFLIVYSAALLTYSLALSSIFNAST